METYPLDIAAEQIVAWLLEEERRKRGTFLTTATRAYVSEAVPAGTKRLGDAERQDLSDVVEVGTLEASQPGAGWTLRVRIEEPLGDRLPEDEPAPEEAEELDLAAFQQEFFRPERGTAFVELDAEDDAALQRFHGLVNAMRSDRHPG